VVKNACLIHKRPEVRFLLAGLIVTTTSGYITLHCGWETSLCGLLLQALSNVSILSIIREGITNWRCSMKYPFFLESQQMIVVDALCKCGHRHSQHDRLFIPLPSGKILQEYCEGKCCDCGCIRFRWQKWLVASDVARRSKKKAV
jgi:hypothetical protein